MERDGYMFYTGRGESYRGGSYDNIEDGEVAEVPKQSSDQERHLSDDPSTDASIDSTGKRKTFIRVMTRFADKTSMQGVPYINSAKLLWAKVLWSVALMCAIGMMGVHLWYLCDQFFSYPKVTKVNLGYDTLSFPTVTLCNTNALHKGRFNNFKGAAELKQLVDDLNPQNLVPDQFKSDYDPTAPKGNNEPATPGGPSPPGQGPPKQRRRRFIEKQKRLQISEYDPNFVEPDSGRTFRKGEFMGELDQTTKLEETIRLLYMDMKKEHRIHLGHNISDMLLGCTFGGRECNAQMFRLTQSAMFGNCWSFDSDQLKVGVSGPVGGLSLVLYLEATEYLEGINHGYGLRLLIHEPGTFPFPVEEGHFVSASTETNIGLKMISIDREQHPYGDCDPDIADTFVRDFNWIYTRRACQIGCEIEAVVTACGCYDDTMEELATHRNASTKPCRTKTERECNRDMMLKITRMEIECFCPVPCSQTAYERSFSSRQWPTDNYAMVLLDAVCEFDPVVCKKVRENLDNSRALSYNFLKLNIYYEDLNFENITEEPEIETAQFVSDVGGAVGLWIGLSLLSLCEIAQLIAEICAYAVHRVRNSESKHSVDKRSRPNGQPQHSRRKHSNENYSRTKGINRDDSSKRSRSYVDSHSQYSHDKYSEENYQRENGIGQVEFQPSTETGNYANEQRQLKSIRNW